MGKSSKDKRDLYYRKAKEQGYRARSAFKLLQLNEEFHFLDDPDLQRVVDLCAAPGSWSQVLSRKLFPAKSAPALSEHGGGERGEQNEDKEAKDRQIVAVDLQSMSPIDHVTTIQADITHPRTLQRIMELFGHHRADLVCSDGAPDVTGLHDLDEYVQQQLIMSALQLTVCVLKRGGTFVAKIFRGRDIDVIYAQLGYLFEHVTCAKPRSSRGSSLEAFIVCQGYNPPIDWQPRLDANTSVAEFFQDLYAAPNDSAQEPRQIAPFMACGSLDSFDSDATYHVHRSQASLDPVQQPTNPPYKQALQLKRSGHLNRAV